MLFLHHFLEFFLVFGLEPPVVAKAFIGRPAEAPPDEKK